MAQNNTFQLSPPNPVAGTQQVFVQPAAAAAAVPVVQQQPPMQAAGATAHPQAYPTEPGVEQIGAHARLHQDYAQSLQSIAEASQPSSVANIYASLARGGYPLDPNNPMVLGDLQAQPQMLDFTQQPQPDLTASHTENFDGFGFSSMPAAYNSLPADLDAGLFAGYPFGADMTIPLHTVETNESIPPEMPILAPPVSVSTTSSKNPSLEPSTPAPVFGASPDDQKMVKTDSVHTMFDGSPEMLPNVQPTPDLNGLPTEWAGFQQQIVDPQFPVHGFYPQESSPGQAYAPPAQEREVTHHLHHQQQHQQPELPEELPRPLPSEAFSRRPSSTAGLVENMSLVGLHSQPTQASQNSTFNAPSVSSLALRRQRRPAQLSSSAFRSASYSAGMPTSPGPNPNIADSHTLRRIRSTGVASAAVGRVQKNPAPAQRSPLAFTFADNGQPSPRIMRNASLAASLPQRNGSLAPPTPATPDVGSRFPPWQHPSTVKSEAPSVDGITADGLGVQWGGAQIMHGQTNSSPPETPMDNALVEQLRNYQLHVQQQQWRDTPPQSAPAFQTTFQQSHCMPPPPPPVHASSIVHNHAGLLNMTMHGRRPSAPDAPVGLGMDPNMQYNFVPQFDAAGNMVSLPVEQLPAQQMQYQMQQPGYFMLNQTMALTPPSMATAPMSTPPQAQIDGNFIVHEYTPPPGSEKLSSPPQMKQPQIKNYTFDNKTQLHFSSPS